MGARVFIGFRTTDILNWSDVAFSTSTICIQNRKRKSQSPHGTRKIVDHLEVLLACVGDPFYMLVWPDYGDDYCQQLNDIAASKVSYSLFL